MQKILPVIVCGFIGLAAIAGEHSIKESPSFLITSATQVVVSPKAAPEVRKSAEWLAEKLNKITGGKVTVSEKGGGILLGTAGDFPDIPLKPNFNLKDLGERQAYEIQTYDNGIYLIGAAPQAVEYAVADLLYKVGYRQYFPGRNWEIIPSWKEFRLAGHWRETPDYYYRRIWPGWGCWRDMREETDQWQRSVRGIGAQLNSGHAYENFIRQNKKEFERHPEYYALVNGQRRGSKLCIGNPGLRKLVCDIAVKYFKDNPSRESFSVEPSDGGGWCECPLCAKLGSPSTRAVILANEVSRAIEASKYGRNVAMYAYNFHSLPPDVDANSNVIVSMATAFRKADMDTIMNGWRKRNATLGIREYYDVILWSKNLPGQARSSDIAYLSRTIPEFYRKGARFMSAEAGDDWGPSGLGYYLAMRLLWNTSEDPREITDDFLKNSFGPASGSMRAFYQLLDGSHKHPLAPDYLGRLYRLLDQSRKAAAGDERVLSRLDDLAGYVRFAELYHQFNMAKNDREKEAFDKLMAFAASIRQSRMVHTYAMSREKRLAGRVQAAPVDWRNSPAPSRAAIDAFIQRGVAENKLLDFQPVDYSDQLVPMNPGGLRRDGKLNYPLRGLHFFYTWADDSLKPFELTLTGGQIKAYRNRGNAIIELYQIGGLSETGTRDTLIEKQEIPPDGNPHTIHLRPKQPGLYRITMNDRMVGTFLRPGNDTLLVLAVTSEVQVPTVGTMYFYVPRGTKMLGFYANMIRGTLTMPDGKVAMKFSKHNDYFQLPVPKETAGKVWTLNAGQGTLRLMTVPSYFSFRSDLMLLPQEVVEKETGK